MKLLALSLLAAVLHAQAPAPPVVPAGLIYQAAAQQGIDYITPLAGQAIINTKAALNWRNVIIGLVSDGSIGVLTAGVSGVIHMSMALETALAAGHGYYDYAVRPLLANGAPNPGDIPPVLQMTGTVAPTATACTDNSMYAVSTTMAAKKKLKVSPPRATALIGGLSVTFTAQGVQVLRNISGGVISQFQVYDVVACVPLGTGGLRAIAPVGPGQIQWKDTQYNHSGDNAGIFGELAHVEFTPGQ